MSKAVKSPLYHYDSGGGEGGQAVVQGPEANFPVEEADSQDWGFASAFLFALSLITTVGKFYIIHVTLKKWNQCYTGWTIRFQISVG